MSLFTSKTIEDIDYLIKNGININQQDNMFGMTYLHILVIKGVSGNDKLDHFLDKNPDLNIKDKMGKQPILYAINDSVIKKLLHKGAKLSMEDMKNPNIKRYFTNIIKPVIN